MKKIIMILMFVFTLLPIQAQYYNGGGYYSAETTSATMTFRNDSQYNMTLKIIGIYKGLHSVVSLPAYSSRIVSFTNSATYKLKIKAVNGPMFLIIMQVTFLSPVQKQKYPRDK